MVCFEIIVELNYFLETKNLGVGEYIPFIFPGFTPDHLIVPVLQYVMHYAKFGLSKFK